jgi:apolipoprotein N-acyltransferase
MSMWAFGASLLAGVLQGFSMAWPAFAMGDAWHISGQSFGSVQCLSLAVLAALLLQTASQDTEAPTTQTSRHNRPQRAWLQGMKLTGVFATAAMSSTWGWLYVSMHEYGGLPSWLACLAVVVLAMALSVYFALVGGVWVGLFRRWLLTARQHEGRSDTHTKSYLMGAEFRLALAGAVLFAALWTLAELARGQWFTGFPWGAAGYAHGQSALAAYAPWVGVYGIGAIASWLAMGLPLLLSVCMAGRTRAWMWLLALGVMFSALIPAALQRMSTPFTQSVGAMTVRLLQGNIPQDQKFIPGQGVQIALSWYGEQLLANTETLVVTPETAIPVLPQQLSPAYWQALRNKYAVAEVPVQQVPATVPAQLALIGLPMGGATVGYSNSVLAMGQEAQTYRYDKQHLVPFGEFVPPFFQWFVRLMNIPLGDFGQQNSSASVLSWQGQRLLPQICYEDLFGEELARYFANEAEAPTVLVNMSNLAWFGDTTAPAQHAAISKMRALEFQRPVIRATNTGLTALIDANGQVKAALPVFARAALVGEFEGRKGLTPYARWTSQWGLRPLWLICAAIVLVLVVIFRRARAQAL